MKRSLLQRYHAELDFSQLTDQDLHDRTGAIKAASGTSQLVLNNPALQAAVDVLVTKDGALTVAGSAVTGDRAKLRNDLATEVTCRTGLVGAMRSFVTLVETGAMTPSDLENAGIPARAPVPRKTLPPDVPEAIFITFPKVGHGKATVSVHEAGKPRGQYTAQLSVDPFGPATWAPLGTGFGRTRVVTGASGTKIWVRFAAVRGTQQSDWCAPVLVTIP